MVNAVRSAPHGLTADELHGQIYDYPADTNPRDPYNNIRALVYNYNHGRVAYAPAGRIASTGRRYYFVSPHDVEMVVIVPGALTSEDTRMTCRVIDGRLVVEGEAI